MRRRPYRWWWARRLVCTVRGHRFEPGPGWCERRCGTERHVTTGPPAPRDAKPRDDAH